MTTYRQDFTYACVSTAFTPTATPTDIFTIQGNAVTNVYVLKAGFSTTQGADGINAWHLIKRTAANTVAGTFTNPNIARYNSNNTAASAVVKQFSANPTVAAGGIDVWAGWTYSPLVTTASSSSPLVEVDFVDMFGQPLTLLASTEILALNFAGAALPAGLSVLAYFVWTESPKT